MFVMRVNDRNDMTLPNTLILDTSQVRNVYYDMNSLINMTVYGGYVILQNSNFSRISICGSLIKNYNQPMTLPNFQSINSSYFSTQQTDFLKKMGGI